MVVSRHLPSRPLPRFKRDRRRNYAAGDESGDAEGLATQHIALLASDGAQDAGDCGIEALLAVAADRLPHRVQL